MRFVFPVTPSLSVGSASPDAKKLLVVQGRAGSYVSAMFVAQFNDHSSRQLIRTTR